MAFPAGDPEERVNTLEWQIERWTHRRDHGDAVPSREILTRWIQEAEGELRSAEATLKRSVSEGARPEPLA